MGQKPESRQQTQPRQKKERRGFRPPLVFSGLGAAIFSGAALFLAGMPEEKRPVPAAEYGIYSLAGAFLALAVWAVVLAVRRGRPADAVAAAVRRSPLLTRLWEDSWFRLLLSGYGSLAASVVLALSKMAAGWWFSSRWFAVLAGYYLVLCLTKGLVLGASRAAAAHPQGPRRQRREWQVYRLCGWMLAVLALTLQGVTILIVKEGNGFQYHGYLIFAVALYDFYCLIASLVYFFANRAQRSPAMLALKGISLAGSLVSMLSLQTAMFAAFDRGGDPVWQRGMNLLTGTAVCLLLVLLGLGMVRQAGRRLREL